MAIKPFRQFRLGLAAFVAISSFAALAVPTQAKTTIQAPEVAKAIQAPHWPKRGECLPCKVSAGIQNDQSTPQSWKTKVAVTIDDVTTVTENSGVAQVGEWVDAVFTAQPGQKGFAKVEVWMGNDYHSNMGHFDCPLPPTPIITPTVPTPVYCVKTFETDEVIWTGEWENDPDNLLQERQPYKVKLVDDVDRTHPCGELLKYRYRAKATATPTSTLIPGPTPSPVPSVTPSPTPQKPDPNDPWADALSKVVCTNAKKGQAITVAIDFWTVQHPGWSQDRTRPERFVGDVPNLEAWFIMTNTTMVSDHWVEPGKVVIGVGTVPSGTVVTKLVTFIALEDDWSFEVHPREWKGGPFGDDVHTGISYVSPCPVQPTLAPRPTSRPAVEDPQGLTRNAPSPGGIMPPQSDPTSFARYTFILSPFGVIAMIVFIILRRRRNINRI